MKRYIRGKRFVDQCRTDHNMGWTLTCRVRFLGMYTTYLYPTNRLLKITVRSRKLTSSYWNVVLDVIESSSMKRRLFIENCLMTIRFVAFIRPNLGKSPTHNVQGLKQTVVVAP